MNGTSPEHCRRVQTVEQQAASNSLEQQNTLFRIGEQWKVSCTPVQQIGHSNYLILTAQVRNAPKATMYLGLGDMWRAVRIHHSLKVRPPPHSNTLSDLEVTSMVHLFLTMGRDLCCPSSTYRTHHMIFLTACRTGSSTQKLTMVSQVYT
jgi:hypothetical protein